MTHVFTNAGLILHKNLIQIAEEKVREVGQEVGTEAGINCDWHDNFGYEDATRRFEQESARLASLLLVLKNVSVIDPIEQSDTVAIGTSLSFYIDDKLKEITIGAYGESEPRKAFISYTSPLAQALLGLRVGESRQTTLSGKPVEIEIVKIYPPSYRYSDLMQRLTGGTTSGSKSRKRSATT